MTVCDRGSVGRVGPETTDTPSTAHLLERIRAARHALVGRVEAILARLVAADRDIAYADGAVCRGEVDHALTWLESVGDGLDATLTGADPADLLAAWADAVGAYEDRVRAAHRRAAAGANDAAEEAA